MTSEEAQAARLALLANPKPDDLNPLDARRDWEAAANAHILPEGTVVVPLAFGGVSGLNVSCQARYPNRAVLYFHGGGYVAGSSNTHRYLAAQIARSTGAPVFLPDYRLAPQHPFPAALTDALSAYRHLLSLYEAQNIVIGGDSAGGGLALALLLQAASSGLPSPGAAFLFSPWTDMTTSSGSYAIRRDVDPAIRQTRLDRYAKMYAATESLASHLLSPLFADLGSLPPMLIQVGSDEVMFDDSQLFAEKARAAGVGVVFEDWADMWHVFQGTYPAIPEALQALGSVGAFINEHLDHDI